MINKLSCQITNKLLNNGSISDEEKDLYIYAFFMLLSSIMYFILSGIIGLIFGCLFESIIFFIAFQLIRKYAGGYHASTETRCEILSTLSILLCALIIRILKEHNFNLELLCITGFSIVVIVALCPLDTPEKPLSVNEFKYFRKISWIILLVLVVIIIISYCFRLNNILVPCCISLLLESVLLIAGKIKRYYGQQANN